MASDDCCNSCCCGPQLQQPVHSGQNSIRRYANVFQQLGIIQILLGTAAILIETSLLIIALTFADFSYGWVLISSGIWCGTFILVTGILGVASAKSRSPCMITGAMVMGIFASLASACMVALKIICALNAASYYDYYYYHCHDFYPYYSNCNKSNVDVQVALHSVLAIIGFIELIASIVHSAYCCAANCQRNQVSTTTTTTGTMIVPNPGQTQAFSITNQPFYVGAPQPRYPGSIQGQGIPLQHLQQIPQGNQHFQKQNPQVTQNPRTIYENTGSGPIQQQINQALQD